MVRRFLCESWMVSLVAANGDDQLNEANLDARIRELQRHLQALQTTPGPFQTLSYSMIHLLVSKFAIVRTTNYQHLYMFCWLLWHSFATYASTTPSKPDKPIIATITSALRSLDGQIQDSFAKSLDRSKVLGIENKKVFLQPVFCTRSRRFCFLFNRPLRTLATGQKPPTRQRWTRFLRWSR